MASQDPRSRPPRGRSRPDFIYKGLGGFGILRHPPNQDQATHPDPPDPCKYWMGGLRRSPAAERHASNVAFVGIVVAAATAAAVASVCNAATAVVAGAHKVLLVHKQCSKGLCGLLAFQLFLVSITFAVLTFTLFHIRYEYSTTIAVLPKLPHSKTKSNNEVCRYTGLQVHTKRPQWHDKWSCCHCNSQPCKRSGAQNSFLNRELNHRPLKLDTAAVLFYYNLDMLHEPPIQVIPHILNRKKSAISLHSNIKRWGS